MNRLVCAAGVWVLGMVASGAWAQGMTMPPASRPATRAASEYGPFAAEVTDLGMDDEQKAKVKQIAAALEKATKAPRDKMMSMHQEFSEALKAEDDAKARKVYASIKELTQQVREATEKSGKEVLALLTPEQKVQLHASGLRKMLNMQLGKVKLTDEQEKKVQEICDEYAKERVALANETATKEVLDLFTKANNQVKDLLTPEQKAQLPRMMPATMGSTRPSNPHGGMRMPPGPQGRE